MSLAGHQPPRSLSTVSFACGGAIATASETVKASCSNDHIVSLGVDHLPFSVRKYPAPISAESHSAKKSLGSKVKDFFLNNSQGGNLNEECQPNNSISYVEDLLKKYTSDANSMEQGVEDDYSSIVGNSGNSALQGDNISFSSISNISNATDMSSEPCAATLTAMTLSSVKQETHAPSSSGSNAASSNTGSFWSSLNRSSSACETCQSQDSGFVDGVRHNNQGAVLSDKTKGIAGFLTKGIFSKLKNAEPDKEKAKNHSSFRAKKCDEFMTKTTQTWLNDVLPHWERGARRWRQTHELWWLGLPPKVRGRVWSLAISNELHVSQDLYKICLDRAASVFQQLDNSSSSTVETASSAKPGLCNKEFDVSSHVQNGSPQPVADKPLLQSLPSILLDLSRTFPQLGLFQTGGPLHGALKNILSAYTCYRPDVGYVQGMSFIASMLLLNMDEFDAFIAFANLINRPLHLALFSVDHRRIAAYVATFKKMLWSLMPELAGHFASQHVSPDVYLFEWLLPIYCRSFSLDVVSRIWDVYIRDGEHFLFKVALAILRQNEASLLASDFDQMVAILANVRVQADFTSGEQLFMNIHAVSKTRTSSSEAFSKLLEESIAEDADRWCESTST